MRGWLLDTNVVSELRKPKPATAVAQFVTTQPGELLFTTEVTFGEIRFGIEQLEDSGRRAEIHLCSAVARQPRPRHYRGRYCPLEGHGDRRTKA